MHADICGWASGAMYEGKLTPAPSVAGHTLADLPHVGGKADDMTAAVLLLLDTAGWVFVLVLVCLLCGFDGWTMPYMIH